MKREEAIYCLKAQSERYSEVCEECPLYGQTGVDHCCEDALQMAITALQNQPVWIPVSERLPEEAYGCLVTVMDYEPSTQTDFENILPYFVGYDGNGWNDGDGETIPFEVIAWMPLPEPYQGSEPHKQTNADRIRSMTENEAIARIRDHFEVHNDGRPHPRLDEAVEMAIKALKKQIPQKPYSITWCRWWGGCTRSKQKRL